MIIASGSPHSDGLARAGVELPSDCSTFRVFPRRSSLHVACLLYRDVALKAALRENGFRIPALDQDEDRR